MDLHDELLGFVDLLAAEGIDYAICGVVALAIHGHPRFTKDIDILIRPEDVDRAVGAVAKLGYVLDSGSLSFDSGGPRAREVRRISKTDGAEDMSPEAIDIRLCELAQLYRLGMSLRGGRWFGSIDESEKRGQST